MKMLDLRSPSPTTRLHGSLWGFFDTFRLLIWGSLPSGKSLLSIFTAVNDFIPATSLGQLHMSKRRPLFQARCQESGLYWLCSEIFEYQTSVSASENSFVTPSVAKELGGGNDLHV